MKIYNKADKLYASLFLLITAMKRYTSLITHITAAICLYLSAYCPPAVATGNNNVSSINKNITTIQQQITADHSQRKVLQTKLQQLETSSGVLSKNLKNTQDELQQKKTELNQLKQQQKQLNSQLERQKNNLTNELNTLYIAQQQPKLKLLLNQHKLNTVAKTNTYYQYLYNYQYQLIVTLQNTLSQIKKNKQQLTTHYKKLTQLQNDQINQQKKFKALSRKRQNLVDTIDQRLTSKSKQLKVLKDNKLKLEATISHLKSTSNETTNSSANFAALKGKLDWPVKGKITENFNTKIQQSELRLTGVVLNTSAGSPIHAIADGKVVFSKWLSGYGLLLIISHKDGYMSLYGQNQSLYKKTGDVVKQGELIATVGQTGGYNKPGLYFAIRHNAVPLNPKKWCKPQHA